MLRRARHSTSDESLMGWSDERHRCPYTSTAKLGRGVAGGWKSALSREALSFVIPIRAAEVAVGISVARYPPRRSVRALVSAYGSYLGFWRQSVVPAKDGGCVVQGASDSAGVGIDPR